MKQESFSEKTKEILKEYKPKKGCCKKTEEMLRTALQYPIDFAEAISAGEKMRCQECIGAFLRIIFCEFGTVSDPEKSFHLEISFPNEEFRDYVSDVLLGCGLVFKKRKFKNRYSLYLKDSGSIEDFFATVGAPSVSFEMINMKMMREVSRDINRKTNFETANLQKTVQANVQYVKAIAYIEENGLSSRLPDDLRETAKLRTEYDTASLSELGELHVPPISKSGVKHRLDKILAFAKNHRENGK